MATYTILVGWALDNEGSDYEMIFGAYDREDVEAEQLDLEDAACPEYSDMGIYTLADAEQSTIDEFMGFFNSEA